VAEPESDGLSVEVSELPENLYFIVLAGELDLASAPQLAGALGNLGAADVILDMSKVTFVDSAGLHVLASAGREARQAGGTVICAAPSKQVQRVFEIVHLGEIVLVEESVEMALSHIERARRGAD